MSTPSNSKAAANSKPKPKRPLSGYNLFYRYKRNKILEATSRPNCDNEAVIRAVLSAPPGLEGVPPHSPLFCLPPTQLAQFRAAAIRRAMEGKLFPNENARSRLHRKVLGMGFVEMGRTMRQMWGRPDKLAKDLFNELADVGRVRYRRLVAEYKLSSNHPTNVHVKSALNEEPVKSSAVEKTDQTRRASGKSGESEAAAKFTAALAAAAAAVSPVKKEAMTNLSAVDAKTEATAKAATPSPIPQQAQSSPDPMLEDVSVWATKSLQSPKPKKEEVSRPSYGRRVSADLDSQGSVPCQAPSFGLCPDDPFKPLSFSTMINPTASANVPANSTKKPGYGRRVSTELDHYGDSLFEPLPVETSDRSAAPRISNQPKWGRRVSTDLCPLPPTQGSMGGAVADNGTANSTSNTKHLKGIRRALELQQILLRNKMKKVQDQIAQSNSVLLPDTQVHPQASVSSGEKAYLEIMASSGPSLPDGAVVGGDSPRVGEDPGEEGVSAHDFMDFIGELGAAIDDHGVGKSAFDAPGLDLGDKPASALQTSVPMPAAIELNTNRARMA